MYAHIITLQEPKLTPKAKTSKVHNCTLRSRELVLPMTTEGQLIADDISSSYHAIPI